MTEAPSAELAAWFAAAVEAIRRRLVELDLSHRAADRLCGWKPETNTTNKIMNGSRPPSLQTLFRLSKAVGLTLLADLGGAGDAHENRGKSDHSGKANVMQHVGDAEADHVQVTLPPPQPTL